MLKGMPFALALILLAAAYRLLGAWIPGLVNFSPLMALTFCSAVYFRSMWMWLVPLAALTLSDLYLDHHYAALLGESWSYQGVVLRDLCFVVALCAGRLVAARKNWLNLFSGALGGSLFFYLVTNTGSWIADPFYAKTASGWWQALTVGRPQYAPTLFFFRNTLISDLTFTAIFAFAMEYAALRRGEPSLLPRRSSDHV